MSLDLSIPYGDVEETECHHCGQTYKQQDCRDFNYTYNAAKMWYAAVPDAKRMIEIEGMTGTDSLDILIPAYEELSNYPEKYQPLEPENGWGSYETFVQFLMKLIIAAQESPNEKWSAGR